MRSDAVVLQVARWFSVVGTTLAVAIIGTIDWTMVAFRTDVVRQYGTAPGFSNVLPAADHTLVLINVLAVAVVMLGLLAFRFLAGKPARRD
jgi:hypothetical protein